MITLPGGDIDRITSMINYRGEIYRDHLIAFTEMKHFYVYKIEISEAESMVEDEDCETIDLEMEEEKILKGKLYNCHFELVKRYPSKHLAHTLIELSCEGGFLTVSQDNLEFWSFKDHKRKKVLGNCYG